MPSGGLMPSQTGDLSGAGSLRHVRTVGTHPPERWYGVA